MVPMKGLRSVLVPVVFVVVVSGVLFATWGRRLDHFENLTSFLIHHSLTFTLFSTSLGVAAGFLHTKSDAANTLRSSTSGAIVKGGASLVAALTVIGGVRAVEHFQLGSGPQVVFIGSGTA